MFTNKLECLPDMRFWKENSTLQAEISSPFHTTFCAGIWGESQIYFTWSEAQRDKCTQTPLSPPDCGADRVESSLGTEHYTTNPILERARALVWGPCCLHGPEFPRGGMAAAALLPESSRLNRQQGWLKTTPSAFPPLFARGREHKLPSNRIKKGTAAAPSKIKLKRWSKKFSSMLQVFEQEKGP